MAAPACEHAQLVADLDGAKPASAPLWATDWRRHGTPGKWER